MSEISRDMGGSTEMSMGMDLFQYYLYGIGGLISGDDDFLPSSLANSRSVDVESGGFKNSGPTKVGAGSLFCNAVGSGLSEHGKERLVAMLCKSVVALNEEVDEMLDPVFSMLRLRALLAPEKNYASCQDANDNVELKERAQKRLKVNEPLNVGSGSCNHSEEGSISGRKGVVKPDKRESLIKCNNTGCGKHAQKSSFDEIKSLCGDCSKQGLNESFLGSTTRDDKENEEVNDVLQVLLVNRGPTVEEKMNKHSTELSAALEQMKEKLEELVDVVLSSCRAMTLAEKVQLVRLVKNLHPQNLDRIVEIIQRGKPTKEKCRDDITIDLQNEDNSTLWRIYFHVKAVENAIKLL